MTSRSLILDSEIVNLFSPVWRDINLELTMKEKDALLGRLVVGRSEEKQLENLETRIRTKPKSSDIF